MLRRALRLYQRAAGALGASGRLQHHDMALDQVTNVSAANPMALMGLRLKDNFLDSYVDKFRISILSTSSTYARWLLVMNPTVSGLLESDWQDKPNSAVQIYTGGSAKEKFVTSLGYVIGGGYFSTIQSALGVELFDNQLVRLGSTLAGSRDTIFLCAQAFVNNAELVGSIGWRELV